MKHIWRTILLLSFLGALFASEVPKNILYLNSYHTGFEWSDDIEKGFTDSLALEYPNANIYYERMDTKRFPVERATNYLEQSIVKKLENISIDAIVTSDDNALNFALDIRELYFPNTPIIFSGVNNPENLRTQKNLTGVLENVDIVGLINLILYVHPNVTHIAVIGDSTASSKIHSSRTISILNNQYPNLTYSVYEEWTIDELENQLASLPSDTIIIELAFHRDQLGNIISLTDEKYFLANQTSFPAYSLWSNRIKSGVLGGVMNSGYIHGQKSGSFTAQVLSGIDITTLDIIEKITFPIYFDYSQMKRFGISVHNLPNEAEVLNTPNTFWFRYKRYLVAATMFVLLQSSMIVFLIINTLKRRSMQKSLNQLNHELEERIEHRTQELSSSISILKETQTKLVEAQKMAALGGLVSGISHKLNTPIGVCLTATSILKQELKQYDNVELETISLLESNLNALASYNQDIKQMYIDSKTEKPETLDLGIFLFDFIACKKMDLAQANATLTLNVKNNLIVETYPHSLVKIISIFIHNSILHGFKPDQHEKTIDINVSENDTYWILTYQDNGQGVSEVDKARLFEPFFTTKFGVGNSGLGLNIAYNEIVHRFKGELSVNDSANTGLSLTLTLPKRLVTQRKNSDS